MSALRLGAVLLTGFLLGCVIYGCSPAKTVKAASLKPDKERHAAPDFALKDADGKTVRLSEYKGKVVLVDFWATYCGPCKIEIPWFMDFERKHKDQGFSVLGIDMDDEGWDAVKPFVSDVGINYRIVVGNDATADKFGGIEALPTTFLIDRQGRIADVHVGLTSKSEFENAIEQLLQAPAHGGGIIEGRARPAGDAVPLSAGLMGAR
ncbi:MAG TPA: redoxin domain-containing protein [Bryobacteraceae bacterium]|jgi:cytochrome c biogenesis protein CcmG/thiol:disulfide interchange protein DsbE|nr:redoxin domain-containing protein [Bryobacteraceae bacterium]